jgi:hypothetical protein
MSEEQIITPATDAEVEAKMRKVLEKLGMGAPAPVEMPAEEQKAQVSAEEADKIVEQMKAAAVNGKDVDWSNFDLDANLAHLYPTAKMVETLEGPKWVAQIQAFEFETGEYKLTKAAKAQGKQSLGDTVRQRVNSPERWQIVSVYASGPGFGVVMFNRTVQIVLPDPRQLRQEAEMPVAPSDVELAEVEDAALGWIEGEGATVGEEATVIGDSTVEAAAARATAISAPSAVSIGTIELNERTVRIPRNFGPNATDADGSVLDTTVQVPAVLALEAGQEAAEALRGPDFVRLEQLTLPIEGEQA